MIRPPGSRSPKHHRYSGKAIPLAVVRLGQSLASNLPQIASGKVMIGVDP